jgi:hypothetical protein
LDTIDSTMVLTRSLVSPYSAQLVLNSTMPFWRRWPFSEGMEDHVAKPVISNGLQWAKPCAMDEIKAAKYQSG